MWHGLAPYLGFVVIVAIVLHLAIRKWIVVCACGAVFCSIANLLHQAWLVDFKINLAWAPVEFIAGCILALPGFLGIGVPLAWLRSKRHPDGS